MFKSFAAQVALAAFALTSLSPLTVTAASADQLDPSPTVSASCEIPNASAGTIYAAPTEPSSLANVMQISGTTYVNVSIDPTGAIDDARIAKSSGTPLLDDAAIIAARSSQFRPEIRDCTPVGGSYLFIVDYP